MSRRNLRQNILFLFIVICTEALMMVMIYHRILRPLRKITAQMEKISTQEGAPVGRIYNEDKSRNEMELLANGINDMLERINESNRQAMRSKIDYLNEHILFLQAQINPHFLFNSFSVIRGLVAHKKLESIGTMADSMATIFRLSMSDNPFSTLNDEIMCAKAYIDIFETRSEQRARVLLNVQEETKSCMVPRMILEPLVENAFSHGLMRNRPDTWQIELDCAIEGDMIFIELGNSGEEIDDERIQRMNGLLPLEPIYNGIGIPNVRSRIELLGGSSAFLRFKKRSGGGVIATICFPIERNGFTENMRASALDDLKGKQIHQ